MDEQIYECEVTPPFRTESGQRELRWTVKPVREVMEQELTEYRCKDCHGAVRLLGKHAAHGPAPHAIHRSRQDSEYCPSSYYFKQNPGRKPRLSEDPVV